MRVTRSCVHTGRLRPRRQGRACEAVVQSNLKTGLSKPASKVAEIASGELKRVQKVDFAD